jgi:hypothetical protein
VIRTAGDRPPIAWRCSASTDRRCAERPLALASWWRADGDATDAEGAANHGTLEGGATFTAGLVGAAGQAFSLDGADDRVRIPHDPSLAGGSPPTNAFGLDAWVKPALAPAADALVVGQVAGRARLFLQPDLRVRAELTTDTAVVVGATSATAAPLDAWTHVAGTWDGTDLVVFVAGAADGVATPAAGTVVVDVACPWFVGGAEETAPGCEATGLAFAGAIDEVRVTTQVLTPAEVEAVRDADDLGTCASCRGTHVIRRTWIATDACGNTATGTQLITVEDDVPPVLAGVPGNVGASCDAVPPPAEPTATDACGPTATVAFAQVRTDGPCADAYALDRTWTATDDCGNSASHAQVVTVQDTTAPVLSGVPDDATVECDAVPEAASVTASDDCDPDPAVTLHEQETPGACGPERIITRTWTATDACDNASTGVQVLTVVDTQAPVLELPADALVECGDPEDPSATGQATADDGTGCDPAPVVAFTDGTVTDDGCPGDYHYTRTWTATDDCGNESTGGQVITVRDTTPPAVTPSTDRVDCLWPPNHDHVTFEQSDFSPEIEDACSEPVTWVFVDCASDQPDDATGNGDGNTVDDCVVAPDGLSVQVRAERAGADPTGRDYTLSVVATDACGNASAATPVGVIHVPHDHRQRDVHDCISAH